MKYRTIQYSIICDKCGCASEGITLTYEELTTKTMYKAIGWHKYKGKDLCPKCYEAEKKGDKNK